MLILAIDTALDACSAAILDTRSTRLIAHESLPMQRGHAEALMPLIARVIKKAALSFAELDRIAVTTGPGSFTGLRVGLAAARGIALAAAKPVVGLTTLTAFAAPYVSESGGHVYLHVVSGNGTTLLRPDIVPIETALQAARFGAPCLVGNAAQLIADRWPADASQPVLVEPRPAPDIGWVAWLGAAVTPETAPARPYYLRAPDAKPAGNGLQLATPA